MKFVVTDGRPWYFQVMSGWIMVMPIFMVLTCWPIFFWYPIIIQVIVYANLIVCFTVTEATLKFLSKEVWKV